MEFDSARTMNFVCDSIFDKYLNHIGREGNENGCSAHLADLDFDDRCNYSRWGQSSADSMHKVYIFATLGNVEMGWER